MELVESLLLSAVLFFAGAITEHDSKGAVTVNIGYREQNLSVECRGR